MRTRSTSAPRAAARSSCRASSRRCGPCSRAAATWCSAGRCRRRNWPTSPANSTRSRAAPSSSPRTRSPSEPHLSASVAQYLGSVFAVGGRVPRVVGWRVVGRDLVVPVDGTGLVERPRLAGWLRPGHVPLAPVHVLVHPLSLVADFVLALHRRVPPDLGDVIELGEVGERPDAVVAP